MSERIRKDFEQGHDDGNVVKSIIIGRPIFGKDGKVAACLNITLPSERYNEEKIPLWLELLGESTLEISKRLGYEGVAKIQARPIV